MKRIWKHAVPLLLMLAILAVPLSACSGGSTGDATPRTAAIPLLPTSPPPPTTGTWAVSTLTRRWFPTLTAGAMGYRSLWTW